MGSVGAKRTRASSPLEAFQKSDGSGVDSVMQAIQNMQIGPDFAGRSNNFTQRLINHLGLHDKPVVLTDKQFDAQVAQDALGGRSLYRGVTGHWGGGMTAADIVKQTMFDDKTVIGTGIHGNGIYFTQDMRYAKGYAGTNGLMQAYIDKNKAKVVTERDLRISAATDPVAKKFNIDQSKTTTSWSDSTPGVRGQDDKLAQYAIYKGYNVIHVPHGNSGHMTQPDGSSGTDFYVPLTREALVFREHARKRRSSKAV